MAGFFEQFGDLDALRDKAEDLWERGVRETKRQSSIAKLRLQIIQLQARKNAALNDLGAKIWEMHRAGTLDSAAIEAALAPLEAVAKEISEAEGDIAEIREADTSAEISAAVADNKPAADAPGESPRPTE